MTKKIKVIIADDEPAARASIEVLLSTYPEFEVSHCSNGEEAVISILEEKPQLVFLDVQMPGMNGFEVIEVIKDVYLPLIIFVTAYDSYALRAFEVSAVDYLLKPYDDDRFHQSLAKARKSIEASAVPDFVSSLQRLIEHIHPAGLPEKQNGYLKKLTLKHQGRISFIPVEDISYLESEGNFVKVRVNKEIKLANYTCKQLEGLLDPKRFIRVHKSYIVNINHIESVEPYMGGDYLLYITGQHKIRLSRNYKEALQQILNQYS